MSNQIGPRVAVPEAFSIIGSQYLELYSQMLDSFGVTQAPLSPNHVTNEMVIFQFTGLTANPDGTGQVTLGTKNYANPLAEVPASFVATTKETKQLKTRQLRLVDNAEIFTAFAEFAGRYSGDPMGQVARVVTDVFLNEIENDLITEIEGANADRILTYTSQATNNAFSVRELHAGLRALTGQNFLAERYSLIMHPNVFGALSEAQFPDIYKLTNNTAGVNSFIRIPQISQLLLSEKCPYDSGTGLYTTYVLLEAAVMHYVHTWELDLNPYGFGTYRTMIWPSNRGPVYDFKSNAAAYFFEAKWAFFVPKYGRKRIAKFLSTAEVA